MTLLIRFICALLLTYMVLVPFAQAQKTVEDDIPDLGKQFQDLQMKEIQQREQEEKRAEEKRKAEEAKADRESERSQNTYATRSWGDSLTTTGNDTSSPDEDPNTAAPPARKNQAATNSN